jgi:hypothetical protein
MLLLAEGQKGEAWEEPFKSTGQSRSLALHATDSVGSVMQPHCYGLVLKVSGPVRSGPAGLAINRLSAELKMWPSLISEILSVLQKAELQRDWREVRTAQATTGANDHHSQTRTKANSAMNQISLGSFGQSCTGMLLP